VTFTIEAAQRASGFKGLFCGAVTGSMGPINHGLDVAATTLSTVPTLRPTLAAIFLTHPRPWSAWHAPPKGAARGVDVVEALLVQINALGVQLADLVWVPREESKPAAILILPPPTPPSRVRHRPARRMCRHRHRSCGW
jgi:hypothetical protein